MLYFFLLWLSLQQPKPNLTLSIHPSTPSEISIELRNKGLAPALVDARLVPGADKSFGHELMLTVTDITEHPSPFLPVTQPMELKKDAIIKLLPSKKISQKINLSDYFDLSPGRYLVQAIYDTTNVPQSFPFWHGKLVSSPVLIAVPETSTHAIQSDTPEKVDVDPNMKLDWILYPFGKKVLGQSTFSSPAWHEASLYALELQFSHRIPWVYTTQDKHLSLALTYKHLLEKKSEFNLSPDEIARLESLEKTHLDLLDTHHQGKFAQDQWPTPIPLTATKLPSAVNLYTPFFLRPSEHFMQISVASQEQTTPNVPVILAEAQEAGYTINDVKLSNQDGRVFFETTNSNQSLLVLPSIQGGPLPHRIPKVSEPIEEKGPPHFSATPDALEPLTEELFTGSNFMLEEQLPDLSLGNEPLPILASTSSSILTQIPARVPGPRELRFATSQGTLTFDLPLMVIVPQLSQEKFHRGATIQLKLKEVGLPKARVWVAVNSQHVIFDDNSFKKVFDLQENQETAIPLMGLTPGSFRLTFGLYREDREKTLAQLNSLKKVYSDAASQKSIDAITEALQSGELSKTVELLEQFRFQKLWEQKPTQPIETILPLIR